MNERKSMSGGEFFLGGRLVSWPRKKYDYITWSTEEAGYVVLENNSNKIMWIMLMLKDIGIDSLEVFIMCFNNKSTISMSKNVMLYSRTKHMSIKCHVLREKAIEKEIRLEYVSIKY